MSADGDTGGGTGAAGAGGEDEEEMLPGAVWYTRELPGGGYVIVEQVDAPSPRIRARVFVERRTDAGRRAGHTPPVVAEAEGDSRDELLEALREIAASNVEVATALRRWQKRKS